MSLIFFLPLSHSPSPISYLTVGKLLVVGKELVGHGRGDALSLHPEAHATPLQDLVRHLCLHRNN